MEVKETPNKIPVLMEVISNKPAFEIELDKGIISKITNKTQKKTNKKPTFVNAKGQSVDENGILLTKRGKVDRRQANVTWKEVAERNKTTKKVVATVDSDSDSEPDFEIELIEPVKPVEPVKPIEVVKPVEPVKPSQTELYLKSEEDKRKKFDEELTKLRNENNDLKSGLHYNNHLNRISHMAKSVKLKF